MSNQTFDFDDFAFEPEEEHGPDDETPFNPSSNAFPPNAAGGSRMADDNTPAAPAAPHTLPRLAAQAAYQSAQQAAATLKQPAESHRADWSAALAEEVALLEALANAASRAPNQAEALALTAALPVVALRLTPHSYRALWPLLPALIQGTQGVTRLLYGRDDTRSTIRLLPAILESSISALADLATSGRRPTVKTAAQILAQNTGQMVQNQQRRTLKRFRQDEWQGNGHGNRY